MGLHMYGIMGPWHHLKNLDCTCSWIVTFGETETWRQSESQRIIEIELETETEMGKRIKQKQMRKRRWKGRTTRQKSISPLIIQAKRMFVCSSCFWIFKGEREREVGRERERERVRDRGIENWEHRLNSSGKRGSSVPWLSISLPRDNISIFPSFSPWKLPCQRHRRR